MYGTDLTQCCTHKQVLGYHSTSARTRSSVSFNGLELRLKLERAARQTINDNKGAYCYRLQVPNNWHVMKQMDLLPRRYYINCIPCIYFAFSSCAIIL